MSTPLGNVRALRPMRVVLVSDDARFADELLSGAARVGVFAAVVSTAGNVELSILQLDANVVLFDAENAVAGTSRRATAFAALHPRLAVGLLTDRAGRRASGGLAIFDKWRSVDRLLGELERAHIGQRAADERGERSM